MKRVFDLETLAALDNNKIAVAFKHALSRVVDDCLDRPGVDKARSITLLVTLKPTMDEHGKLDTVHVGFDIRDKLPNLKSRTYVMGVGEEGLVVNELSPEDPRQSTIDEHGGDGGAPVIDHKSAAAGGE